MWAFYVYCAYILIFAIPSGWIIQKQTRYRSLLPLYLHKLARCGHLMCIVHISSHLPSRQDGLFKSKRDTGLFCLYSRSLLPLWFIQKQTRYIYSYIHQEYIHIHTYTHTCIYIRTHAYTYSYMHSYVRTYVRMYTYIHKHTHTHTYTHIHIYTYTYSYMHSYMHTYMRRVISSELYGWVIEGTL